MVSLFLGPFRLGKIVRLTKLMENWLVKNSLNEDCFRVPFVMKYEREFVPQIPVLNMIFFQKWDSINKLSNNCF